VPAGLHKGKPLKALFIGTRFAVKGGDVLLELCKDPDLSEVEWHFITPEERFAPPNAHFYKLKPETDELIARIQSCDVLVSPTRSDMLSLAAIESHACGLAVIIRNMGATSEVVEDGVSGYVIDRSDRAAVKEALMRYVLDPGLATAHGKAGREAAVKRYAFPVHAALVRAAVEAGQ
jgi:glycosyltransferase involved in cell wall biosynthesis